MFDKFKYNHGIRLLVKEYNNFSRICKACNLSEAGKIGIIYNATNHDNFNTIKSFVNYLKSDTPEVTAMGYVDRKELGDSHIKPSGFSFFCKKDLNWHMKPIEESIINFINTNFDILIDFDFQETLPMKYVVAESRSTFKVGRSGSDKYNKFYDLTLNINNDPDIHTYFIEQLKIYLNMIKTK